MEDLISSAHSAGTLLSNNIFEIPRFQREYSWSHDDEVEAFWSDLKDSIDNMDSDNYFLGLIILVNQEEEKRKLVIDGQQRLITLNLLIAALYHRAIEHGRKALVDRLKADFLHSINYTTDASEPRIQLANKDDDKKFQDILERGKEAVDDDKKNETVSGNIMESYEYLDKELKKDLEENDPFKRLGEWAEFLTKHVYMAVFIHPNRESAYQVYEIINTRGKELTTADLIKNYILQTKEENCLQKRYEDWQRISSFFPSDSNNTFVQYIRHVMTIKNGHILPRDLFKFIARRKKFLTEPPDPDKLIEILDDNIPLYLQMMKPERAKNTESDDAEKIKIFKAFNDLGVIAVRPILLSISKISNNNEANKLEGMKHILKLVVRRMVVGPLGTGSVEKRFGETARKILDENKWEFVNRDFDDLNQDRDTFINQLKRRPINKRIATFMRRSILQNSITPNDGDFLHLILRKNNEWGIMLNEYDSLLLPTIGNTFLANSNKFKIEKQDWKYYKDNVIRKHAVKDEWIEEISQFEKWDADAIREMNDKLAEKASKIWYTEE